MTKADLEAMLAEFDIIERYADAESTVEMHLHQVRRNARLGLSLEEWATARNLPLTYAKALQRFVEQR